MFPRHIDVRCVLIALLCAAAAPLPSDAVNSNFFNKLNGAWRGVVSGNCELTVRFEERNYVAIVKNGTATAEACGCQGAYLGSYSIAGDGSSSNTIIVQYSAFPSCYTGTMFRPIQVSISGNAMGFKDLSGSNNFDTTLDRIAANPTLEGIWTGSEVQQGFPFVADISGPLYLSYVRESADVISAYYGLLSVTGDSFSISYAIWKAGAFNNAPVGTVLTFSGGKFTAKSPGWDLLMNQTAIRFHSIANATSEASVLDGSYAGQRRNDAKGCGIISIIKQGTFRSYNVPDSTQGCSRGAFLGLISVLNSTHLKISYGYATNNLTGTSVVARYTVTSQGLELEAPLFGGIIDLTKVTAPPSSPIFTLRISANFSTFTDDDLKAVVEAIASRLGVPSANIVVLSKTAGSVKIQFSISKPDATTATLPSASEIQANLSAATTIGGYPVVEVTNDTPSFGSRTVQVSFALLIFLAAALLQLIGSI